MITDSDIKKIQKALKPYFDRSEKNIKQYIHEGVNATVDGVDNLLSEYDFQTRVTKLEKIHPQGRHRPID